MNEMPIRVMQFEFDSKELKKNIPSLHFALGFSMTLPHLEPYLIRTMLEALKETKDESVAKEVKQFIGQEAQHFRQHRLLNDMLINCHDAFDGLKAIEDEMEADYQHFTKNKSLKFNLAYAEGFEAATCALARNKLENIDLDSGATMSAIEDLFTWHLMEEIEHRTVTFNIYDHLYGDYLYRLFVGIYGQYHFFKYVFKFTAFVKRNQPQSEDEPKNEDSEGISLEKKNISSGLSLLKNILKSYLPWYNPANIVLPASIAVLSKRYTESAIKVRSPA